jgi:hypothetical protein
MDMLSFVAGFMTAVGKAAAMREFRTRLQSEEGVPVEKLS